MEIINNVKGTHDIIGKEAKTYGYIEYLMKNIAELFGYNEIVPPVMEYSEVFVRGVGSSSDVVRKEMYTFLDKADRSITLRPEFTAGIVRVLVQNKLLATNELPLKSYYCGPVFRYERPQLGRYRQFNQFGVEAVGHNSPFVDAEVISLAYTILTSLGLENIKVKINTLGDASSRDAYRDALKTFFKEHIDKMCPDCKSRYELNPLRILDCKVPEDQEIVKLAPKMTNFLNEESKNRFKVVLDSLDDMGIPYEIDDTLVRGLDYYSDTVFEFHYTSSKGNNYGAIGAGGHYDKLVKQLGGPDLPGIGFSFGIERVASIMNDDDMFGNFFDNEIDFYVMPMGENSQLVAVNIANFIRMIGAKTDICFDSVKLSNMFKRAEKKNAKFAVIIGENEIKEGKVIIKNLSTQEQMEVTNENLEQTIVNLINKMEEAAHHHDENCCCGHNHEGGEDCCCGHHHEDGEDCCCNEHNEEEHECCCGHHHKENK